MKFLSLLAAVVFASSSVLAQSEGNIGPGGSAGPAAEQGLAGEGAEKSTRTEAVVRAVGLDVRLREDLAALRSVDVGADPDRLAAAETALDKGETDEAAAILAEIRADESVSSALWTHAKVRLDLALAAANNGDHRAAMENIFRSARLLPDNQGLLYLAQSFALRAGNMPWALRYARDHLDLGTKSDAWGRVGLARATLDLAIVLNAAGRHSEAEPLFRKSLKEGHWVLYKRHPVFAAINNKLAYSLEGQGRHVEAESLLRQALSIHETFFGEDHPATLASYNRLGRNLKAQGRDREAAPLFRQSR